MIDATPKCLIVDDLEENLVALRALLANQELEIVAAQSGEAALEELLKHEFAFAMVDVQMPGMDGFELAEIMRSTDKTRSIPIIFVTAAGADVQKIFRGYEAGAVDFLHKPLFPQVVLGKVQIFKNLFLQKKLLEQKIEDLRRTEDKLQRALRSRDEFLSICSHELKTPLTSLKLLLQLRRRNVAEERTTAFEKLIDDVEPNVERLIHLVSDMLDHYKVSAGEVSLKKAKVDLGTLTAQVAEELSPLLKTANCKLSSRLEPGVKGVWDRSRIEQVLHNLLTNAAKYAPESKLELVVKREGHFGVLVVKDSGPGINQNDQERIFGKFERAIPYTSVSGLGLGLYISKGIVELHQGKILVESRPGEGAEFIVKLPLAG